MLPFERFCLRVVFELDQLESDWIGCIETRDPEAVAAAYRMLWHHMQESMRMIGMLGVGCEIDTALEAAEIPGGHVVGTACPFLEINCYN